MKATENCALHPEGRSKSPEASFAWVLATGFVKRKQRVQKPRDRAAKFLLSQEVFTLFLVGTAAEAR